ncbi:MAG: LysR family transcriptional regulator, partial [Pseudomonadota bacterium]
MQVTAVSSQGYAAKMQEDWDDLRLVLALARGGGVSAAATALGLDPTTVTRRLARAERRAGAALIARTAQGLRPTEAGRALMQAAERAEAAIQGAQAALGQARGGRTDERAGRGASGHVRLTAVPILANRVIVPALPAHLAAHPQLRVELVAEPRNLAVMERETDIALRLARPERELAAKARRIGRLGYAVYAAAGCDPAALPWIGYGGAMAALPQARWIEDRAGGRAALPLRVQ